MMKEIQITVARETSGWGKPWYCYSEQLGGIDYDWNGDGWTNCGSPRGEGKTIQEAIEDFLENVEEEIISFKWS